MYIETVPNRGSPPAILLRESYRDEGKIKNRNDLVQKLDSAIVRFAKRQQSWFRRMERHGVQIHWVDKADFETAKRIVFES